jgi:hypothetical protein
VVAVSTGGAGAAAKGVGAGARAAGSGVASTVAGSKRAYRAMATQVVRDEAGSIRIDLLLGKGRKTDHYKAHLKRRDLEAARRELHGEVVARKATGVPYDHLDEVQNAQRGLADRIRKLKRALGAPGLDEAQREALQRELGEASRLLDRSEGYVPRP